MEKIYINDDHIKLGQALKLSGIASSGVEAKIMINTGQVKVNNEECIQRGKKLFNGDVIETGGNEYIICKEQ